MSSTVLRCLQKRLSKNKYHPGDCPTILLLSSASVSRLKPLIEQLLVKKRISFVFIDDADLLLSGARKRTKTP
jgi:hypothetical protein